MDRHPIQAPGIQQQSALSRIDPHQCSLARVFVSCAGWPPVGRSRPLAGGKDPGRMTAKDVMSSKVVCCAPEDDIAQVIKTMQIKRIRRLPVTDSDENIVGMHGK